MLYPSMPELLKNVNSRYLLVNVIALRARQIAKEAEEHGEHFDKKPVSSAIQEIADGKIVVHLEDNKQ